MVTGPSFTSVKRSDRVGDAALWEIPPRQIIKKYDEGKVQKPGREEKQERKNGMRGKEGQER